MGSPDPAVTTEETSGAVSLPALGEFRMTRQRREVYDILMSRRDHPSASEVFVQVKEQMPSISLATVYNCLETMTQCGLVKQVNMDREPSRYCANLNEHAHFYCQECGEVSDIGVNDFEKLGHAFQVPSGTEVARFEVTLRGICSHCKTIPTDL